MLEPAAAQGMDGLSSAATASVAGAISTGAGGPMAVDQRLQRRPSPNSR